MRVVHLIPHFDNSGNGVVNAAIDLACSQARLGMNVTVAGAGEGSFRVLLEKERVNVHSLPGMSARHCLSSLIRMYKIFRNFEPEIVHAHMVPGAVIARLLRRGFRYKLITSVHNSGRFVTPLMFVGDLVICVSNYLASEMRSRGLPFRIIRVVKNGPLGSPRLPMPPPAGHQLNHPAILTISEPASHKGIGDLIEAFSLLAERNSSAHLYILGDGVERLEFERRARATPYSDRIVFCGFVADPSAYLQSADIFVLASHREGFGLVLAEARKFGTAIVATDVGGIPEVLDDGSAGILVPVRSPKRLALALQELIEDSDIRDFYRKKASSNLEWLSSLRTATETISIYHEACGRESAKDRSAGRLD